MGGELEVESTPGKGSRFFFTVPLPSIAEADTSDATDDEGLKPTCLADGYRVLALVADDNKENRDVLSFILSDIGVTVITAENGQQAVQKVHANRPDIVFMDIRMPQMDGLEATRQILENIPSPPKMVAISASALAHEQQRYLESGFDDFIPKPFKAQQVYTCLANLLHIEYVFETAESAPVFFSDIFLPKDLYERLKEAAEITSVTELRNYLQEIESLGETGQRLAEQMRTPIRNYDMETILNILSEIRIDTNQ